MMLKALRLGFFRLLTKCLDDAFLAKVQEENPFFMPDQVWHALDAVRPWFDLKPWRIFSESYPAASNPKRVGIIMAGNIPLVGLHDLIATLMTGHVAVVKPSHKDKLLMTTLINELPEEAKNNICLVHKIQPSEVDFLLATGSDNTARQLEFEFGKVKKLIRKNRYGVAVLNGKESNEELEDLMEDILRYHGMGCRNVSNLIVPSDFDAEAFVELIDQLEVPSLVPEWSRLVAWEKAILEMGGDEYFASQYIVLEPRTALAPARPGVINLVFCGKGMERSLLTMNADQIQVTVGHAYIPFGKTQAPRLFDFADNVDTFRLLSEL